MTAGDKDEAVATEKVCNEDEVLSQCSEAATAIWSYQLLDTLFQLTCTHLTNANINGMATNSLTSKSYSCCLL
jgi:hypothetical protein